MDSSASFIWSFVNLFVALFFLYFVLLVMVSAVVAWIEHATGEACKLGDFLRSFGRKK